MTMTDHLTAPPPELVQQWCQHSEDDQDPAGFWTRLATQAARWGADQELEACIEVILSYPGFESPELFVEVLRDVRRPKPPSLKAQALVSLNEVIGCFKILVPGASIDGVYIKTIRRALDALPDDLA